ncbi:MAG TPA: hypothetical protein PLD23_10705 [Armatimonadota bacterium]|nr:hypothetical protein [Armatimonadota bacterium]
MMTAALVTLSTFIAQAAMADMPAADMIWDGVRAYDTATVANSPSSTVQAACAAGQVTRRAIGLHPGAGLSTVTYPPLEVEVGAGQRALLVGYAGISDGVPWDDAKHRPDGVTFHVIVDGEELFVTHLAESVWRPFAIPLGPGADGVLRCHITLATDAGPAGNSSYDWAFFGEPAVVAVSGSPIEPRTAVGGLSGILLAHITAGEGTLAVEGIDEASQPVPGARVEERVPPGTEHAFLQFDFAQIPECAGWRWVTEGPTCDAAHGGCWAPSVRVAGAGPAQAITLEGEPLYWRVTLVNDGRGVLLPEHRATIRCGAEERAAGQMAPGDTQVFEFDLGPRSPGDAEIVEVSAELPAAHGERLDVGFARNAVIWPALPPLPNGRPGDAHSVELAGRYTLLENRDSRWLFGPGFVGALVYAWGVDGWEPVGSLGPLAAFQLPDGSHMPDFDVAEAARTPDGARLLLTRRAKGFLCRVSLELPDSGPALSIDMHFSAEQNAQTCGIWGPEVRPGDRVGGSDKGVALFPGLEYLEGAEASSSTRDLAPPHANRTVPPKFHVTLGLMAVEIRPGGPLMGIAWDPRQRWDGEHMAPAAVFSSPDQLDYQDNHLMHLALPSVPAMMPRNERRLAEPMRVPEGTELSLSQRVFAGRFEPDASAVLAWYDSAIGYPEAEGWPRSFEDEMALSRHAFLVTVWDEATRKSRHVVGWDAANSPGFATLLLTDGRAVTQGEAARQVLDRAELIGRQTLEQDGPSGLTSSASCHIMGGEFPYHWGQLPAALVGLRNAARAAMARQEADGGWGFYPDEKHATLGEPGTKTAGIAAPQALQIAKWAAISGDPECEAALRRAVDFLRAQAVPRGAQGWECPILQPDVLASAYAVRACVWAYMALGDPDYIEEAQRWARTGLAFQYAWDDGAHPGMRYASIPVFGSTFHTHSWIGLPVQWCGLVYAYSLQELCRIAPDDLWRRQIEGITVSAMHQQWPMDNAELAGTYPDSYGKDFTVRNGVFINPEGIVLNLLAMRGFDPGLRSRAIDLDGARLHMTAAAGIDAKPDDQGVRVTLSRVIGPVAYATIGPVTEPADWRIMAGGRALERKLILAAGDTGWAYDADLGILAIGAPSGPDRAVTIEVTPEG